MPLSADARVGPYAIVAPLGAGGMGEVYLPVLGPWSGRLPRLSPFDSAD